MSSKSLKLCLIAVSFLGLAIQAFGETRTLTESFNYVNGTTEANGELSWAIKLDNSRTIGVESNELILNRGGKHVVVFHPVFSGKAQVSVSLDASATNKKAPDSSRFHLMVSVDGNEWEKLESIQGSFNRKVAANFSTNRIFQLRIVTNGSTYAQRAIIDNIVVSVTAESSEGVASSSPLWLEDFSGLEYKAKEDTGGTAWKEYSASHSYSGIKNDTFKLSARRSSAFWESEVIDISQFLLTVVNAQLAFKNNVDSMLQASVDGGEWQTIWEFKENELPYFQHATTVKALKGNSLKLRMYSRKWTGIELRSVDVFGLEAQEVVENQPPPVAQFLAIHEGSNYWFFDASISQAINYKWEIDGNLVSNEAAIQTIIETIPASVRLTVTDDNQSSTTISFTIKSKEADKQTFSIENGVSILSWPAPFLSFTQVAKVQDDGNLIPIGYPLEGTGWAAYFISSTGSTYQVTTDSDFGEDNYSGQSLDRKDMGSSTAHKSNFMGATGRMVYLDHSDLSGSNWSQAAISFSEFHNSNFSGAILINASFIDCVFDFSDFSGATLIGANFSNSDFRNARFSNADLTGTDFTNADLRGADFEGANIDEAILTGALLD